MSEAVALQAKTRDEFGTGPARTLRKEGWVPIVIYGKNKETVSLSVEEKEITKLYRKPRFISSVIEISAGSKKYKVLPKEVQLHPTTELVRHADFVFLEDKIQKAEIPILFEGKDKAPGVKKGGFFNIVRRTVKIYCPVSSIPREIIVDVGNMQIGRSLRASKISLPEGCSLVAKTDFIVASIVGRAGKDSDEETQATTDKA